MGFKCFTAWICSILLFSFSWFHFIPSLPKDEGNICWVKEDFPSSCWISHIFSFSIGFLLNPTLRVWVLRKHWVTGRALCVCRGLWANCSSCCSTRQWPSASRWWSERLRIWPSSRVSQELQVKTSSYYNSKISCLLLPHIMSHMSVFWCGATNSSILLPLQRAWLASPLVSNLYARLS